MASAGTAYVDIEAKLDQLESQIAAAVEGITAIVSVDADTSAVEASVAEVDGQQLSLFVDANTEEAQQEVDSLDGGEPIEKKVEVDTKDAESKIDSLGGAFEQLASDLGPASGALKNFGTSLLDTAGVSAAAATGYGALAVGVGMSVSAAMDAQVVQAQTAALLDTTGASAYLTGDAISSLGEDVMGYSGFSDEAVASGENMLLMFQNVSSEAAVNAGVFERTTELGADMATIMGGDVTNAIRTLGRAVDDPTAGMGRLRRAGIQLTEAQQEQIKALQASGDLLGAQQALLDIVSGKVDGLAESYGDTLAGQLDIAGEKFDNVKEEMGNAFIPTIQATVGPTLDLADAITQAASAAGLFTGPVSSMRQSLDAGGVEGWTAQLLVGGPALNDWSREADGAAKAAGRLPPELDKSADSLDELTQSIDNYLNATFGLPGAQRELRQSFSELSTAMAEGTWDDQAIAAENVVSSTAAVIQKQQELGATTHELDATIYGSIATLARMRAQGQITGSQFDTLSGQIAAVPHQATTEVSAPGADGTLRQLREVKTVIDGIDRNIVVQVSVPNLGAIAADVRGAAASLRSLRSAAGESTVAGVSEVPELLTARRPATTVISTETAAARGGVHVGQITIHAPTGNGDDIARAVTDAIRKLERAGR